MLARFLSSHLNKDIALFCQIITFWRPEMIQTVFLTNAQATKSLQAPRNVRKSRDEGKKLAEMHEMQIYSMVPNPQNWYCKTGSEN